MEPANTTSSVFSQATNAEVFISEAEKAFNAKNLESNCAVYAEDAEVDFFTDGIHDRFVGIDEIREGWRAVFKALPHFELKKEISMAEDSIIINEWVGSIDRSQKRTARGIEIWRLNKDGKVVRHRLYSFFRLYEADSWRGKMHFGITSPVTGFRLEKERRRSRDKISRSS